MAEKDSDTPGKDSLSDILEESKTTYSGPEGEPEPEKEPETEPEPLKYKTHEEAEKAYREAERKMHESTTLAKKALEEKERYQTELEEFKKKQSEPKLTRETVTSKVAETLKAIGELDSSVEDYEKVAAEKWSELLWGLIPSVASDIADERVKVILESKEKESKEKSDQQTLRDKAITIAKESGLDMKTNIGKDEFDEPINSPDFDLFFSVARRSKGETFEDQVNWTIKEVKRIKSSIGESFVKIAEKGKDKQKLNQPLETGHSKPPESEKSETPISITSALKESQKRI